MDDPQQEMQVRYDAWITGGAYSDDEASFISGLPVRALRELQQLGALTPLSSRPGRGNRRLWDREAITRAALTSAVMLGGFSLPVAARLATAWANSFSIKDAFYYMPSWSEIFEPDPGGHAPTYGDGRLVHAVWFSDTFAHGQVDEEADAYLQIIDGEHLIARVVEHDTLRLQRPDRPGPERQSVRLGRLVDNGSAIVSADYIDAQRPLTPAQLAIFDQIVDGETVRDILKRFHVEQLGFLEGGGRFTDPGFLGLRTEESVDTVPPSAETRDERRARIAGRQNAEALRLQHILHTACAVTSINMTLAERKATRRMLGLTNGDTGADLNQAGAE